MTWPLDMNQLEFDFAPTSQGALDARSSPRESAPSINEVAPYSTQTRSQIERSLARILGASVQLTVTDNLRLMISARTRGHVHAIRLHHMFLGADETTLQAIARYVIRGDRSASRMIDQFIEQHRTRIRHGVRHKIRTQGQAHDLHVIRDEICNEYFLGQHKIPITWGHSNRTRMQSIRLGSYQRDGEFVQIHRALDHTEVPRYVIAWVIYHELLHHVLPPTPAGVVHSPDFLRREAMFKDLARAQEWQRLHLARLLRSPVSSLPCTSDSPL